MKQFYILQKHMAKKKFVPFFFKNKGKDGEDAKGKKGSDKTKKTRKAKMK